jgi:toxin ParE1/3/4
MPRLRFTRTARADLLEIHDYIARDKPVAARKFTAALEAKCRKLADMPHIGTRRDELAEGLRCLSAGNYVIYFTSTTEEVVVVRVLHGARDLSPWMFTNGNAGD